MTDLVNAPGQVGRTEAGVVAGQPASARGSFRGERVEHVRNPTAELQDAAEELTFAEGERVEKKISQRKLRSGRLERSAAVEQAEKYLREVPDLERKQKLSDFVKRALERGSQADAQALLGSAREFSDDATHQFLALTHLREELGEAPDPALGDAADEALATLESEHGPAIRAGLNVSAVAGEFAGTQIGDVQELRDFYRDVVLDCEDIQQAYQRVVEDHPGKSFEEAVRFMLKALGADLAANTQSVSKAHLSQIMDDMYQLKSLNTAHEQCEDLVRRVRRNYDAAPSAGAARDLLGELLEAQGRAWQGADAFTGLPQKLGVHGDEAGIYLLQGFKELVRFVPIKAFGGDATVRDRVMLAVQEALDVAIDNEEFDD